MAGGGYSLLDRHSLGIAVWWIVFLGVATDLLPVDRIRGSAAAVVVGFGSLALTTLASSAWAPSAERAFLEVDRVLVYLGLLVLTLLAAGTSTRAWSDGLAIGIVGVAVLALASRLFPDLVSAPLLTEYLPSAGTRLSYPLNYWNGLGVLCALGLPLLLRAALDTERALVRGTALAPTPLIGATLLLTSSRGAIVTAAAALLVFCALAPDRARATLLAAVAIAGGVSGAALVNTQTVLIDGPFGSSAMTGEGRTAAVLLALASLATAAAAVAFGRLNMQRISPSALRAALGVVIGATVLGVWAADPASRLRAFQAPPSSIPHGGITDHLLSESGSGRWQFWQAAADAFERAPLVGHGAGTFEAWWASHGTVPIFVRDGHSLYLEILAELGVVGLLLFLVPILVAVFAAARGSSYSTQRDRSTQAALLGVAAGFAVAAAIDWMWEMTIVGSVGVVCLALAVSRVDTSPRTRIFPIARVVAAAGALAAVLALMLPLLVRLQLDESRAAARSNQPVVAIEAASVARDLQPWASSPYVQLALVEESAGEVAAAMASIEQALARDSRDWRLWLVATRLQTKAGAIVAARRSLARARELNPRSQLFPARG